VIQTSGALVGDGDCPEHAVQQCTTRRNRELRQAVVRRRAPDQPVDHNDGWTHHGSHSPGPKRDVPPPTSVWPSYPSWSPSPSKPKPSYPPSTPQPCNFRCPQQDLAKNPLTDEAFRDSHLFCSYSTPHCKTCSFCEYSTVRQQADNCFRMSLTRLDRKLASFCRITTMAIVPRLRQLPALGTAAMLEAPFLRSLQTFFRYTTL
jgi:hypothetical protein